MKEKVDKKVEIPKVSDLEKELKRVKDKSKFNGLLKNTIYTLIVVSALAVLVAVFYMPVIRIYGSSMEPTLKAGDIVVSVKTDDIDVGDIIGVYYGSKLLVKRVIAKENQWVNIDDEGNVFINGEELPLDEPYLKEKFMGELDIELPYKVPEKTLFIMGDNRETSVDSRNSSMGCIDEEEVVGKIIFRVWPFDRFESVK